MILNVLKAIMKAWRISNNTTRMVIIYSKSMDQPGKVANPARGQLNNENEYLPVRVRA